MAQSGISMAHCGGGGSLFSYRSTCGGCPCTLIIILKIVIHGDQLLYLSSAAVSRHRLLKVFHVALPVHRRIWRNSKRMKKTFRKNVKNRISRSGK